MSVLEFSGVPARVGPMVSLEHLNATPDEEFVSLLGGIYEHSDWVPRRIVRNRPFADAGALRRAMAAAVDHAGEAEILTLIRAHPDLAGKLARAGGLTESSTREQAGLGLDRLNDEDFRWFSDANARYREQFGFPFIICARLTTLQGVKDAFQQRLPHARDEEIAAALREIHQIARLRLADAVGGNGP